MISCNKACYLFLALLVMVPVPADAMPAITCHCFTDRSYDPARPAVADPYFLATTQNSFFAAVFNVDKKTIVMKKQTGTSADDLWIAYWIANRGNVLPENVLEQHKKKSDWNDVIATLHLDSQTLGSRFARELQSKAPGSRLAATVVDELFIQHNLLRDTELSGLRKQGITNQQIIIAAMIGAKTSRSTSRIFLEVKNNGKSWGSLLNEARIDSAGIPEQIAAFLKNSLH